MSETICVPGVPTKRYNPCLDPQQKVIPHVVQVYKIEKGTIISKEYKPNDKYYSEYNFVIQLFIDKYLKQES